MANNIIGETAISCAWPPGTPLSKYKYSGGKPTKAYKAAVSKAKKIQNAHLSKKRGKGASCDIFPWAVIVSCGADKKFPSGLTEQKPYLRRSSKWKRVSNANARGGDVQHRSNHIQVVVERNGKRKRANAHYIAHGGTYGCMDGNAHLGIGGGYKTYRCIKAAAGSGNSDTLASSKKSGDYTEYYYTKPKNFEDVKDEIIISENPDLEPTIRIKTLNDDYERIIECFPSIGIQLNLINVQDVGISSLKKYYQNFLQKLILLLTQVDTIQDEERYIYFLSNNKEGLINDIVKGEKVIREEYNYYTSSQGSIEDWMDLYLEMYYKYCALLCYEDAIKTYTGILGSSYFSKGIYQEVSNLYNQDLSDIFNQMIIYRQENTQVIETADQINKYTKDITNIIIDINLLKEQLNIMIPEKRSIEKELNKLTNKLNEVLNIENNFKNNYFSNNYKYWNREIIKNPDTLNYWIEFLDNDSDLEKYSIMNIGDRPIVTQNDNIESVYLKNIPQIIYYSNDDIKKVKTGYTYLKIEDIDIVFSNSRQGISAKDEIDNLLYQHSYATEEISFNIIPIYYLEPNVRFFVYNEKNKINNDYILNKISLQIGTNLNMNLTASKAVQRLY